jgi:hypothetical protein
MLSQDKVIGIYCIIDDILKGIGHYEDCRIRVSDSEIITTAVVSAIYFGGHHEHALGFMKSSGMIPRMLDKSRFSRRIHRISELIYYLFFYIGRFYKEIGCELEYILDSFPVAVCDNIRIANARILQGKKWRGKHCSMRRYFYGVKVQLLTTQRGIPVEFCFVPGSESDVRALDRLPLQVPAESSIYADSAYTFYQAEDDLLEAEMIFLKSQRRSNAKRIDTPSGSYLKEAMRKRIETAISEIKALFLRKIHAVTFKGFLLKVMLFVFAIQIKKTIN